MVKNYNKEFNLRLRKKGEKFLPGWHIPGGIIRFKEKVNKRLKLTAFINVLCELYI